MDQIKGKIRKIGLIQGKNIKIKINEGKVRKNKPKSSKN